MKHTISTGSLTAAIAFATATALFAQDPQTTTAPQAPQTTTAPQAPQPTTAPNNPQTTTAAQLPAQAGGNTIVATGCLRAAPSAGSVGTTGTATTAGAATGTAGTAGATTAGDNADQKFVLMDASVTGDPSSSSATTTAPEKHTYALVANPTALSPHVGKKLELTGTIEDSKGRATETAAAPDASQPVLRVTSGKIVAASCDDK